MSTPEQPGSPALTRKQLRDIRNTGATPIVTGDEPQADSSATDDAPESATQDASDSPTDDAPESPHSADQSSDPEPEPEKAFEHESASASATPTPLPRAALPVTVHDLPGPDASVDLGVAPLTRRQARQQELIRTASVPVITPEVSDAHKAAAEPVVAEPAASSPVEAEPVEAEPVEIARATEPDVHENEDDAEPEPLELVQTDAEPAAEDASERAIVNPRFGSELLAGEAAPVELPPSFDQLITRSATGSVGTSSALILSQTPSAQQLVAPVTATGEVLITGSFDLPEGLGSTGHAPGTADGKEVDAVLVDGELPAHSSPTPIAASAAISTVKNGGDIIKPPAPEKGGKLMLTLAITAGVLALALVGVLILAFVTGVF